MFAIAVRPLDWKSAPRSGLDRTETRNGRGVHYHVAHVTCGFIEM